VGHMEFALGLNSACCLLSEHICLSNVSLCSPVSAEWTLSFLLCLQAGCTSALQTHPLTKESTLIGYLPIKVPDNWTEYVDRPLGKELERLRQSVLRQSPYGAGKWIEKKCKELGLESTVRPKGRPRKWD
jgi:hypothetical protein